MEDSCKDCRSWEEEIYWSHFQCIHFIQFLHAGFDQQLAIPEKFTRNLKKKLGATASLKGPSGAIWTVGITANDNTLFFNHGWPEFAKHHLLGENDILFFKYNGDSHFDVLMFDGGSQCEKEASYFVRKCGHADHDNSGCQTKRKSRESSVEVIPTPSHYGVEGSTTPEKTTDNDTNKTQGEQPNDTAPSPNDSQPSSKKARKGFSDKHIFAKAKRTPKSKVLFSFVEEEEAKTKPEADHNGSVESSPHYASSRRPVTLDERNNALKLAQEASTPESFIIAMRPTHVYKKFYVAIPAAWMTKYLTMESQDVILRVDERTWTIKFLFWKPRSTGGFSGGWKNFAEDNNLDEYDVCVFTPAELTTKPIVLDVHIFRVVNEVVPLTQVAPESYEFF